MRIAQDLLDEIVAHAREDLPNECCGAVAVRDGRATKVYRLRNVYASPVRFKIGVDLQDVFEDLDETGDELGAIYHSHPRSEGHPSLTDMALSEGFPPVEWIIVGHVQTEPVVRSFRVSAQSVEELPLEVA